ncbi:MAG: hypothetical protein KC619_32040 [Myxococcales bacterium]|nr:hypothetical protein [Myxococcales bacterium]
MKIVCLLMLMLCSACGGSPPAPVEPRANDTPCGRAIMCCQAIPAGTVPGLGDCDELATASAEQCEEIPRTLRAFTLAAGHAPPPECGSASEPGPVCARAEACCRALANDPSDADACQTYVGFDEPVCEDALITHRGVAAAQQEPIPHECGEPSADACEHALECCRAHHASMGLHPEDCVESSNAALCESDLLEARNSLREDGHEIPDVCGPP